MQLSLYPLFGFYFRSTGTRNLNYWARGLLISEQW